MSITTDYSDTTPDAAHSYDNLNRPNIDHFFWERPICFRC